jgi:4-amino-4-deoxy-L-arabinose transferase-like glycosyltransferase
MTNDAALPLAPPSSRRGWWLSAIALSVVYALSVNNQWAISPDGALYLTLGRSLAEGRGMEFNGAQWWGIPPVLPLLIAACRLAVGSNYWLVNLLLSACGVLMAWLAARTVERRGARDLAIPVFLITGFSAYLFITSTRIQTDVLFACLVALGLYGFVCAASGSSAWAAVGGALALLAAAMTRLPGLIFLVGAVAGLLLTFWRPGYVWRVLAAVLAAVVVGAVFWLWAQHIRTLAPPGAADYLEAVQIHSTTSLQILGATFLKGLRNFPTAIFAAILGQQITLWVTLWPTLLILLGFVVLAQRRQWILILPVIFYIGFLLVWGQSAVARRYLLPAMPYLVYALLVGVQTAAAWLRRHRPAPALVRPAGRTAILIVTVLCLAISLPKIGREIFWMRHPRFYGVLEHGRWQGVVDMAEYLRRQGHPETDEVVTPEGSVVHYLSGLRFAVRPIWQNHGPWDPNAIPPAIYAKAAVESGAQFVAVPTDKKEWSPAAMDRLAATGVFRTPPTSFNGLALFERLPPPGPP